MELKSQQPVGWFSEGLALRTTDLETGHHHSLTEPAVEDHGL
jgi:hypothetical protein